MAKPKKPKFYVCSRKGTKRKKMQVVKATVDPTEKTHGKKFGYCTGPYRTKKAMLKAWGGEIINPSQYGAVITSEGVYTKRRRKRR